MNRLKHLEEFKRILESYHISDAGRQILNSTKLVLFVGPTSSGRNRIIRELVKTGGYRFIVSDTTRAPRVNDGVPERNGVEYWFRTEEEILDDLRMGKFLEAAIIHNQQVSGISLRELKKARDQGKIAVNEIETVGTHNIMQAKPDTLAFFVIPPSFEEWINRLDRRGQLPDEEKRRRMESAVKEFEAALSHDYYTFVINDELDQALEYINNTVNGGRASKQQELGRRTTEELLAKTREVLKTSTR